MPEQKSGTSTYATILAGSALDGFNSIMVNGATGPLKPVFVAYGQVLGQGVGQGIANKVPLPVEIALAEVGIVTTIAGVMLAPTLITALGVGAIAFAASAAIVGAYENFEPFRNALDAQADWVVDVYVEMGEWIGQMQQDMASFQETLSSDINTAINQIGEWVEGRFTDLQSALNQVMAGLGNAADGALQGLTDFVHSMKDIAQDIMNGDFSNVPQDILDYINDLFSSSGDTCSPIEDAGGQFSDNFLTPLVFQLSDGLSLQLTQLENSPTFFDLDVDGFKEQTGWTTREGFLVVDRNGNGVIDSQAEMFGQDATGSAWDKLRVYDTSKNGVISGSERTPLKIWIDANGNGTSEAGELKTLQQAGIASINLTQRPDHFWVGDHEINGGGSFTKTTGGTGKYYDVYFKTNQLNSWYVGTDTTTPPAVDIETLFLPLSRGYGSLKSLHYAMTADAGLKAKVEALATSTSYSTLNAQVEALLYDWAGVDAVAVTSGGDYMSGRTLNFMERLTDTEYFARDIWLDVYDWPITDVTASGLQTAWAQVFSELKERLLAQSVFADVLGKVAYDFSADALLLGDTLSAILTRAQAAKPTTSSQVDWYWRELGQILVHNAADFGLTEAQVKAQLDAAAGKKVILFDVTIHGTTAADAFVGSALADNFFGYDGNDYIYTYEGNDSITAGNGNDSVESGAGDDTLLGGAGDDYLWGESGNNYLDGGSGNDQLVIMGENIGRNTLIGGVGDDMLFASSIYVTTIGSSLNGGDGSDYIAAGDGNDTLLGGNGNDILYASGGNDSLDGGADVDTLYGGDGNDRLIGNTGADYIEGENGKDTLLGGSGNDTLLGGDGNDSLEGGDDADSLVGGLGVDIYKGGNGADIFEFQSVAESTTTAMDRISDFVNGVDKIQIHFSIADAMSDLSFSLYTTSSGEVRTMVEAIGSGGFKFYIVGNHLTNLDAADFIF